MLAKNSHSHRTRGATKNRITLPMVNTGFGQNTFSCRAAKVWNVLPDHMICDRSLLSFKTSISSLESYNGNPFVQFSIHILLIR